MQQGWCKFILAIFKWLINLKLGVKRTLLQLIVSTTTIAWKVGWRIDCLSVNTGGRLRETTETQLVRVYMDYYFLLLGRVTCNRLSSFHIQGRGAVCQAAHEHGWTEVIKGSLRHPKRPCWNVGQSARCPTASVANATAWHQAHNPKSHCFEHAFPLHRKS